MSDRPLRLLVVDDELAVRESMAEYLIDCGYDVTSTGSAEEALSLMTQRQFDVGLIDLRLTGMSGETLILRAREISPVMKFLIHTGSATFSLPQDLKNIGMLPEQIFIKPQPDMNVFAQAIEKLRPELESDDKP